MMPSSYGNTVLLTGAGFTQGFGGFLAKELWSLIFNHSLIDKFSRVKDELRNEFNYERLYNRIIDGEYEPEEKQALKNVIREAYIQLDESVGQTYHEGMVNSLVERFSGEMGGSGFFFTLNQDLFIERDFASSKTNLSSPGINNRIRAIREHVFTDDYYERLPQVLPTNLGEVTEPLSATRFHYIKLHGSLNWKRSDGSDALVIGEHKVGEIEKEPLLNWYLTLFKEELSKLGRKLLIVGYGFGDEHINDVIMESMRNQGLRVYVVSPSKPSDFMNHLYERHAGAIWDGLTGYYPKKLRELLEDQNALSDLIKTYFQY